MSVTLLRCSNCGEVMLDGYLKPTDSCSHQNIEETDFIERSVAVELAAALRKLVRANEEWNADVQQVIGRMPKWTDGYLDEARAALSSAARAGV